MCEIHSKTTGSVVRNRTEKELLAIGWRLAIAGKRRRGAAAMICDTTGDTRPSPGGVGIARAGIALLPLVQTKNTHNNGTDEGG